MPTAKEKAEKKEAGKIDVRNFILIEMIFDGDKTKGWVHTHGMWETFDLPDLEIINVNPRFLMPEAGRILNHIAQYMVDGTDLGGNQAGVKPVKLGEKFGMNRMQVVQFELATPLHPDDKEENAGHYTKPRWRVSEVPEMYKCALCESGQHKDGEHKEKR